MNIWMMDPNKSRRSPKEMRKGLDEKVVYKSLRSSFRNVLSDEYDICMDGNVSFHKSTLINETNVRDRSRHETDEMTTAKTET